MQIKHSQRLAAIWLLLSILLTVLIFSASQSVLQDAVQEQVRRHLLLTLDEAHFGNARDGENDRAALQRIGQQMNTQLQDLVTHRWYSPQDECVVRLQRIDDAAINNQPMQKNITFSLPRNQVEREIVVGMTCSPKWQGVGAITALLGFLFLMTSLIFPPPLSKAHRQWINYLLERGYNGMEPFDLVHRYNSASLTMNTTQLLCLEHMHDRQRRNFGSALKVVTDARVAGLAEAEVDWFLLGLRGDPDRVTRALELASAMDSVEIDLHAMKLCLRGVPVPIGGTPLFYYAWYAMRRQDGDGWITNPASNRPDRVAGQELIQLMNRFDGHARAINDLERNGLKARTLDQNRSKIKDEIVAVLGEQLADAYLFEASRHPDGVHTRYRLRIPGRQSALSIPPNASPND